MIEDVDDDDDDEDDDEEDELDDDELNDEFWSLFELEDVDELADFFIVFDEYVM